MRVIRRIIAAMVLPVLVVVAALVGTLAAVVFTPAGHRLLARVATEWITRSVAGEVVIGAVRGNIWGHIELDDVTVRDSTGVALVHASRLAASYLLPELLSHRLVFRHVEADSLAAHLVQWRGGRWNYQSVFRMGGTSSTPGGPPPLVALDHLVLHDASIRLDVPTQPEPPRTPVSRNGKTPAQRTVVQGIDGLVRVYQASDLDANLALLRISTPRRDPLLARVNALQMRFNDPAVTIAQLAGEIIVGGDSVHFALDSAALPDTHLRGSGAIRWPQDTVLFDFALDVPSVALRDLWWIQPDFPDWTGRGHVVAKSVTNARTDYALTGLALSRGDESLAGKATVVVDNHRGLGLHDLDMQLHNTPIDLLRPYLDTLPVRGALTGHLVADGFLDSLRLVGNVQFADALVAGAPTSHLDISGTALFGGASGAVFQHFALQQSSIALATVHRLVPSVQIRGNLLLDGELDGPWQNVTFHGVAQHVAPDNAVSRVVGTVRLDTRHPVLGLGMDADFDRLSFDALRSGYPDLPSRGGLTGHVIANGNLDSLDIDATLAGEVGTYGLTGRVTVDAPHYGADSLMVRIQRADVNALTGNGPSTSLNGRVTVRGAIDSGVPPRGSLVVALDQSRFGGATVDAVEGVVRAGNGVVTIDTGTVIWNSGRVDARGSLGWAAPDSGTLMVHAVATSLTPFDSLVRAVGGIAPDTLASHPLSGQAVAQLTITGARDNAHVAGTVTGTNVILDDWHVTTIDADLRADSLGKAGFALRATADTIGKGAHVADHLDIDLSGRSDSLRVAGTARMTGLVASAGGVWNSSASVSSAAVDSLVLRFPHQRWALVHPARVTLRSGQLAFADTVRFNTGDGTGNGWIAGTVPGSTPGHLDLSVVGLELLDVFGVLERDTTALDGLSSFSLHLAGTRDAPTMGGSVNVVNAGWGDVRIPALRDTFAYADHRLASEVSVWRTGRQLLDARVSLPLDLALTSRPTRKLPGPLTLTGVADSVDVLALGALFPTVQSPSGAISFHVTGSGTWDAPTLEGAITAHDVAMTIPSLNVRYGPINGSARFVSDSLVIDSMAIHTTEGSLDVKGGMRFVHLGAPTLDLRMNAQSFLAIDAQNFLTLRATGAVRIAGPLWQPVLTGDHLVFTRSVFYFADLITKDVVDLEDPENAALIDTTTLRQRGLQNDFTSRFLDSLRINRLGVRIGDDVWLRSAQANIQLNGQLTVDKDRRVYELTGTLNAPRGTYTLQLGPINRDFSVDQGTVTYYGTPDLNAGLSIQAHNQVRTIDGDEFNVVATITGTIRAPKVDLTAPGRNLTERDLLSYVLFGRSEFQLAAAQQNSQVLTGASSLLTAALSALSSNVSQSFLTKGSGIGLSTLTIQPGATPGAVTSGSSVTQFAAGLQFGSRTFVTFDAGVCLTAQAQYFQKRNFGASIEYRFSREFRLQAAAEPVQSCITNRAADVFTTLSRYELGGDFLWQREY